MQVRSARIEDRDYVAGLSQRVQDKLTRSGSLQEIGPIPAAVVAARIEAQTVYVLEIEGQLAGSVFIVPADPSLMAAWGFVNPEQHYLFLHKLMIEPEQQGKRLGRYFVEALQQIISRDPQAVLTLDCWAGNTRLRDFYSQLGFRLQGVFDEGDYQIAVFVWPS